MVGEHADMQEYTSSQVAASGTEMSAGTRGSYAEHLPEEQLHKELSEGTLLRGRLNMNRLDPLKGTTHEALP